MSDKIVCTSTSRCADEAQCTLGRAASGVGALVHGPCQRLAGCFDLHREHCELCLSDNHLVDRGDCLPRQPPSSKQTLSHPPLLYGDHMLQSTASIAKSSFDERVGDQIIPTDALAALEQDLEQDSHTIASLTVMSEFDSLGLSEHENVTLQAPLVMPVLPKVMLKKRAEVNQQLARGAHVSLNVYEPTGIQGWVNQSVLEKLDLGVFHVGVAVYGKEWFFTYCHAAWSNSRIHGIQCCIPKKASGSDGIDAVYRESVDMGTTSLGRRDVQQVIRVLRPQWRACSYHLTQRNCLTFASVFCEKLGLQTNVPARLAGMCSAVRESQTMTAIVDGSWNLQKWWQTRTHEFLSTKQDATRRSSAKDKVQKAHGSNRCKADGLLPANSAIGDNGL